MVDPIDVSKVLFLDIETVSEQANYSELSDDFQKLWKLKCRQILRQYDEEISAEVAADVYTDKAGIFAEFGKIVCISVGIVYRNNEGQLHVRLKSFADQDERQVLVDFIELIEQYYNNPNSHFICGHNIREFDIPYVCRRMVIHQLPFPQVLNLAGKKPWETRHLLDTLELWKFGDYKHYTSLKLLAAVLGFPSPKDDIDGSEVGRVFWEENDLPRIAHYCEKDVLATIQLFLKYKRMPILTDEQVTFIEANEN